MTRPRTRPDGWLWAAQPTTALQRQAAVVRCARPTLARRRPSRSPPGNQIDRLSKNVAARTSAQVRLPELNQLYIYGRKVSTDPQQIVVPCPSTHYPLWLLHFAHARKQGRRRARLHPPRP